MAVPLSQRLLPPAGPKTHFRSSDHTGVDSGQTNTCSDHNSTAQVPLKDDQCFKNCCVMKDKDTFDMGENSVRHSFMGSSSRNSSGRVTDGSGTDTIPSLTLWERTVVSDTGLFQLQYMDLGEFLTENGMDIHGAQMPSQSSQCPSASPSSCSSSSSSAASATSPTTVLGLDMLGTANCLQSSSQSNLEPTPSPTCPQVNAPPSANGSGLLMPFEPDPSDVERSTIPGQDMFDPCMHQFKEEELKPQPVIKKARKRLVPDTLKDEKYWSRRLKNNEAAKRSRDARRIKENQISVHAAYLERENAALRQEVANMRKELGHCRSILKKYEGDHVEQS